MFKILKKRKPSKLLVSPTKEEDSIDIVKKVKKESIVKEKIEPIIKSPPSHPIIKVKLEEDDILFILEEEQVRSKSL